MGSENLSLVAVKKVHVQLLIEHIAQRLPGWKGKWINRADRLTLVSSILSFIPTYHLTVFSLAVWARKRIDRIKRSFLWEEENANMNCLVNWATVRRPKDLDRFGILDLDKFGRALHLRWLWQEWVDDTKPWVGMDTLTDDTDRALFTASTRVVVGDGHNPQMSFLA
jgi:hypothetical protein